MAIIIKQLKIYKNLKKGKINMSFRCEDCGKHVNGSPKIKVTETRPVVYEERIDIENRRKVIDKGGEGWEIVSEKQLCEKCFNEYEKNLQNTV